MRPHYLAFFVCVLVLLAFGSRSQAASAQSLACTGAAHRGSDQLNEYESYLERLSSSERALSYWVRRHDELLNEQTRYVASHLEPSATIQKDLTYAQQQRNHQRNDVMNLKRDLDLVADHAKWQYQSMVALGCTNFGHLRLYIAEHPGALASELKNMLENTANSNTWAGTWDTGYGRTVLDAGGNGAYAFCNGRITSSVNTINGDKLTGHWEQAFPCGGALEGSGDLEFTLDKNGKEWSGRWRYASKGGWYTGWHGTCVSGACLSNRQR